MALTFLSAIGSLATPASAAPASTVVTGYANVSSPIPTGQWTAIGSGNLYNSTGQGAFVMRSGQGSFQFRFPGLGTAASPGTVVPGVVHAHATLSGSDVCLPSSVPSDLSSGTLLLSVKCFDRFGQFVDPFALGVTYTRGGSEIGQLNTVRLSQADINQLVASPASTVTPAEQFTSLGTPITVKRDANGATGFYNLSIPRNSGARPHSLDVSAVGGQLGVVCNITAAAADPLNDTIENVRIGCHNNNGTHTDTPVNISFAEDVNTLGVGGQLSYAYTTPVTFSTGDATDPPVAVGAAKQRNVFRGVSGDVTFQKLGKGHFQVFLENQNLQRGNGGAVSVVPLGNSSASKVCGVADDFSTTDPLTGKAAREVRFVCSDRLTGTLWEAANFQLNYTARLI